MRRREFVGGLAGAAVWPLAARAQQTMPVIGILASGSPGPLRNAVSAFWNGLGEVGFFNGQNVAIEYRWAEGQYQRLPELAADLVRREVNVIVTTGGPLPAIAAKDATRTIPIVFSSGGDPVKAGLVTTLDHPGRNITGVYILTSALDAKRLEVLCEILPIDATVAAIVNSEGRTAETQSIELKEAAQRLGRDLHLITAASDFDLETLGPRLSRLNAGGVVVAADPFFFSRRDYLVGVAARLAKPAMYEWRDFVLNGGLMSYGSDQNDAYRRIGVYAGRILKGDQAQDLPVQLSTKVELVINLKTAKELNIILPLSLLGRADEVIE